MKKLVVAVLALLALAAAACFVFFAKWTAPGRPAPSDGDADSDRPAGSIAAASPANAAERRAAGKSRRVTVKTADGSLIEVELEDDDMAPEDAKRMEAIADALEKDSFAAVSALVADVQTSTNAEVRSELVDALGTFGAKALVDLLPFMADPDADVAESARSEWTMALGEVANESAKCRYIEEAMKILTDEDTLEEMVTELTDCDERLAIQTIVNVIASGTPQAIASAKEQYEFITGEEYTNMADAETWLQENYTPEAPQPDAIEP